jgi:hypothetical protein
MRHSGQIQQRAYIFQYRVPEADVIVHVKKKKHSYGVEPPILSKFAPCVTAKGSRLLALLRLRLNASPTAR